MDEDLVVGLARTLVEEQAPHELPMFAATSREFLADPGRVERQAGEEPLGFGAEVAEALTPIAFAVAGQVVAVVSEQVRSALQGASEAVIRETVRKLFARILGPQEREPAEPAALTPEQLAEVKAAALAKAADLGLPSKQGRLLADSVAGALATG